MPITESNVGSTLNTPRARSSLWGGPFVLGLLIALLGLVALYSAFFTSVASFLLYGALLLVGGIVEVIHAFRLWKKGPFLMFLLGGILSMVVGALVLARPAVGLVALTFLLAGYLFASGLFRGITSITDRYTGWGWDFAYGIVSVVLGIIIFARMPVASLYALGIVVGLEIFSRGIAIMAGSLAVRGAMRQVHA